MGRHQRGIARLLRGNVFGQFEMPSFLPIKLYVFVIGMWIALGRAIWTGAEQPVSRSGRGVRPR